MSGTMTRRSLRLHPYLRSHFIEIENSRRDRLRSMIYWDRIVRYPGRDPLDFQLEDALEDIESKIDEARLKVVMAIERLAVNAVELP